MFWEIFIGISLSSAVLAVLFGKLIDVLIENWRIKKDKENRLYKPVRFYLKLSEIAESNGNLLFEEMKKGKNEIPFNDQQASNNWQMETNKQVVNMVRPKIDSMLGYIEKIKSLFESNPELIEDKHWEAVKSFFDGDLKRKMLIAGGWPQAFLNLSESGHKEWEEAIFKALNRLRKEI